MTRARRSAEDRIALRQARYMGVALSAEEYEDSLEEVEDTTNDLPTAGKPKPIQDSKGNVKMERLLAELLTALGINVPPDTNPVEFQRALYAAAMEKIRDLTGNGQSKGQVQGVKSGASRKKPTNPLIPGNIGEVSPTYPMSLESLRSENERLKMAKHQADVALAACVPLDLTQDEVEALATELARRMGALPE